MTRAAPVVGGSSPLARGLRDSPTVLSPNTPDHPRSRGVYQDDVALGVQGGGSSPLARGLHRVGRRPGRRRRIIPARAGFTRTSRACACPTGDHPRSRGVYTRDAYEANLTFGSSPLARGLREPVAHRPLHVRIIPARAGFTPRSVRQPAPPRDHPRSRGVYRLCRRVRGRLRGSSPLARGLLERVIGGQERDGIIPARAGFTPGRSAPYAGAWDHPRSRGGYQMGISADKLGDGSSPLARGLR